VKDRDRQVRFWTSDDDYLWFSNEWKKKKLKSSELFRIMRKIYEQSQRVLPTAGV
jgi:hypothetical protein